MLGEGVKIKKAILVLVGLAVLIVTGYFVATESQYRSEVKFTRTKKNAAVIKQALAKFFEKCGRFPNQFEGIKVLMTGNNCYSSNLDITAEIFADGHDEQFKYTSSREDAFQLTSSEGIRWSEIDVKRILTEKN